MGTYTSRLFSYHNDNETVKTKSNSTSPCRAEKIRMCTPPMTKRKLGNDPRSATIGIARTPIEVNCTPPGLTRRVASALPKYLQNKRYLETDFDTSMPITTPEKCISDPRSPNVVQQRTPIMVKPIANYFSPVIKINQAPDMDTPVGIGALDPRSPAIDFDRTPILKPKSPIHVKTSNDETIVHETADSKNNYAILSYCETTTDYNIPEIQTIYENVLATKESLSLENIFYPCENLEKSTLSHSAVSSEETSDASENEEQITVIRNTKILSSYHDAISTWTDDKLYPTDQHNAEKSDGIDESLAKTLDNDISEMIKDVIKNTIDDKKAITNNDKIKVWRDSTSPSINEEIKSTIQKTNEEIIIEFDDETIAKNSKIYNTPKVIIGKNDDDKSKNQMKKKKSQQQQENEENKHLTEERKIFNNEGKNLIDVTLNRTPLGNRSNNHKQQRQLVTAKSPQQLLRNKGLSARKIQQENTPPTERYMSKTKPHGIQWDPDTTVII